MKLGRFTRRRGGSLPLAGGAAIACGRVPLIFSCQGGYCVNGAPQAEQGQAGRPAVSQTTGAFSNTQPCGRTSDKKVAKKSISVFFPCYNEQENVGRSVERAVEVLENLGVDFEVIVVDDGSSDATGQIGEELASRDNRVKVVRHERNLGYGAALVSGFKAATKELVFYTDGDGQFDIAEMPALVPLMDEYDIVSCYRLNRQDNLIRRINAWCWTQLVCALFGMRIRDIDCAFKLYKRKIFDNIKLSSTGALIDAEILALAVRKGYRIIQKGVHHYPRTAGEQTGANLKVIARAFKELFNLYRHIRSS